jgi:hypothetical protein
MPQPTGSATKEAQEYTSTSVGTAMPKKERHFLLVVVPLRAEWWHLVNVRVNLYMYMPNPGPRKLQPTDRANYISASPGWHCYAQEVTNDFVRPHQKYYFC